MSAQTRATLTPGSAGGVPTSAEPGTPVTNGRFANWPEYGKPDHRTERQTPTPFGERLRQLRHARNLSQSALAARADLHQQDITRIERGDSSPTLVTLQKLSVGLNVSMAEMLEKKPFGEATVIEDIGVLVAQMEAEFCRLRSMVDVVVRLSKTRGVEPNDDQEAAS